MGIAKFDSRKTYFDGAGRSITGCQKTEQAIKLAGLDYTVEKRQIFLEDGVPVKDSFCTVKSDDGTQLGVVGKDYGIVQNSEAFDFIDSIIKEGAEFECAGSFKGFRKTFMVAKTEPMKILDDDFQPYLLFTNSFDGSGSVRAAFTPVRVFCSNAIVMAFKQAVNKITIRHSSNALDRLYIARETLLKNTKYLEMLKANSEEWAKTPFSKADFKNHVVPALLSELKMTEDKDRKRNVGLADKVASEIIETYNASDLQNYNNTAYKAIQAVADYESHARPMRDTNNPQIYMQRIMAGMVLLHIATDFNDLISSVKFRMLSFMRQYSAYEISA